VASETGRKLEVKGTAFVDASIDCRIGWIEPQAREVRDKVAVVLDREAR